MIAVVGFTAIAVDTGYTYHVKAQLQRTADAAAMAAASQLASTTNLTVSDILAIAQPYAQKNLCGNVYPQITASDVVLGRNVVDGNGKPCFQAGVQPYDSIKISVRLTANSPNGAIPLFFGGVLGKSSTELIASACATLIPRDVAIVIDLSRSMDYDSQFRHESTGININEVWQDLGSRTYGKMTVFHTNASSMPTYSSSTTNSNIIKTLGLNTATYPYTPEVVGIISRP